MAFDNQKWPHMLNKLLGTPRTKRRRRTENAEAASLKDENTMDTLRRTPRNFFKRKLSRKQTSKLEKGPHQPFEATDSNIQDGKSRASSPPKIGTKSNQAKTKNKKNDRQEKKSLIRSPLRRLRPSILRAPSQPDVIQAESPEPRTNSRSLAGRHRSIVTMDGKVSPIISDEVPLESTTSSKGESRKESATDEGLPIGLPLADSKNNRKSSPITHLASKLEKCSKILNLDNHPPTKSHEISPRDGVLLNDLYPADSAHDSQVTIADSQVTVKTKNTHARQPPQTRTRPSQEQLSLTYMPKRGQRPEQLHRLTSEATSQRSLRDPAVPQTALRRSRSPLSDEKRRDQSLGEAKVKKISKPSKSPTKNKDGSKASESASQKLVKRQDVESKGGSTVDQQPHGENITNPNPSQGRISWMEVAMPESLPVGLPREGNGEGNEPVRMTTSSQRMSVHQFRTERPGNRGGRSKSPKDSKHANKKTSKGRLDKDLGEGEGKERHFSHRHLLNQEMRSPEKKTRNTAPAKDPTPRSRYNRLAKKEFHSPLLSSNGYSTPPHTVRKGLADKTGTPRSSRSVLSEANDRSKTPNLQKILEENPRNDSSVRSRRSYLPNDYSGRSPQSYLPNDYSLRSHRSNLHNDSSLRSHRSYSPHEHSLRSQRSTSPQNHTRTSASLRSLPSYSGGNRRNRHADKNHPLQMTPTTNTSPPDDCISPQKVMRDPLRDEPPTPVLHTRQSLYGANSKLKTSRSPSASPKKALRRTRSAPPKTSTRSKLEELMSPKKKKIMVAAVAFESAPACESSCES